MGWNKIAHECEDAHDSVLRDRGDVGAGDFEDLDVALYGRVQVDMVETDAGGDAEPEVLRLREGK